MKRIAAFSLFVLCAVGVCPAQTTLETAGSYYVYDNSALPAMTPAPEGYAPFYISHFGRHGARYCTGAYDTVYETFTKASDKGILTEAGKDFLKRYQPYYKKVKDCKGNLTGVGKEQPRSIARHLFERFPEVFHGPTHIEAVTTESARVIMSMWSCLSTLQALDKDIDINADASTLYAPWLQPSHNNNPYLIKDAYKPGKEVEDALAAYFEATVPWKEIAGKFFTDITAVGDSPKRFLEHMMEVVTGTRCLDQDQGCFDDVFTAQELEQLWKMNSATFFMEVARYEGSQNLRPEYAAFTLGQIIKTADLDLASGNTQLRLRFGHDSGIAPLLALMDVNGCGRTAQSFEESLDILPNYLIPMGTSLQLIFYKNAQGNILFKVLLNEQEATLPLDSVSGPYYSWETFREHYTPIVQDAKWKIYSKEPLAVLKATDWGWQPVPGSKVEIGNATVKVFDSYQTISLARFPLKAHGISVVESDGPEAMITSEFGKKSKALAAINGSYFNMKTLEPVTYVKDEGKVLCVLTTDGEYRNNAMLRIQDKKGRKIDIAPTDSLRASSDAKGWREAIVSGPLLLNEGSVVCYEDDGSRNYAGFYARRHPRTLMGYTADGWVYFMVVDGRFPQGIGMSISELQVLCESLGLYEAINLDGGGSSTLWNRETGVVNHPYDNQQFDHEGERTVPNVIIVK